MDILSYQQQVIREEWEKAEALYQANLDSNGNRIGCNTFFEIEEFAINFVQRINDHVDETQVSREQHRMFKSTKLAYWRMLSKAGIDLTGGLSFIPSEDVRKANHIFYQCALPLTSEARRFVLERISNLLACDSMERIRLTASVYKQ